MGSNYPDTFARAFCGCISKQRGCGRRYADACESKADNGTMARELTVNDSSYPLSPVFCMRWKQMSYGRSFCKWQSKRMAGTRYSSSGSTPQALNWSGFCRSLYSRRLAPLTLVTGVWRRRIWRLLVWVNRGRRSSRESGGWPGCRGPSVCRRAKNNRTPGCSEPPASAAAVPS